MDKALAPVQQRAVERQKRSCETKNKADQLVTGSGDPSGQHWSCWQSNILKKSGRVETENK
jgi:hypothetical protein